MLHTDVDRFHARTIPAQMMMAVILAMLGLLAKVIDHFYPAFFRYPYFSWQVPWEDISHFWPLFAYCAVLAVAVSIAVGRDQGRSSFLLGATSSILAGVWGEVGYRCAFVFYAMISITFANFLFSTVLGSVIGIGMVIGSLALLSKDRDGATIVVAIVVAVLGFGALYLTWIAGIDPIFWVYRAIVIPVISFITLGQFVGIFHNGYPELFVFGLVLANAWFRDGHKYQGTVGWINAWIVGFVLMYAMLHYGLLFAIVLHILYDLEIDVIRYLFGR